MSSAGTVPGSRDRGAIRLDVAGLVIAGIVNTILAPAVAGLILGPGMITGGGDLASRSAWIAEHTWAWRAGWAFWFVVTLTFAWSYLAMARHLGHQVVGSMAVGLAVAAAAVDMVGITIAIVAVPPLAASVAASSVLGGWAAFEAVEVLAFALVSAVAFALYTVAGILLVVAAANTRAYPRWLTGLGVVEWGVSAVAVGLLAVGPGAATPALAIGILLFGPWAWSNAWWIHRRAGTIS